MRVLIDTNVIIDILERRKPFFQDSYKIIQLGLQGKLETFMSAGAVTDVYYVIRKSIRNSEVAKEKIVALSALITICDTVAKDITSAITLSIADFEDAVIAAIAKRERADFIVSRNEADFTNSPVPAISPAQFLHQFLRDMETI